MDDEPMWAADHVVAPTPGSTNTIPEIANEFDVRGNHLTLVKGNQFDGRTKIDPYKHIYECLGIYDMFKYRDTENEAVCLMMHPVLLTEEAKTWLDKLNERKIQAFSQQENESLTDAWLRMKEMLRNCHGHNLSKGNIIKIFYHGLNEITQEVLNAAAGETFMGLKTQLETVAKNHQASIQNLETKFDRLADKQSGRLAGSLPSNTQPNPKRHNSKSYQPPQARNEHVNVVFTRSERMIFNIDSAMKHSYSNDDTYFSIDVIDEILKQDFDAILNEGSKILHFIEGTLLEEEIFAEFDEFMAMTANENFKSKSDTKEQPFEKITINTNYKIKTSLEEPPTDLEFKPLPDNLIIWNMYYRKNPFFFLLLYHLIFPKKRKTNLYPSLKSISKPLLGKQQKFLGIVCLFGNTRYNLWMTRSQLSKNKEGKPYPLCAEKGGITVVTNENDELVPSRTITGWQVCNDYHKLNEVTAKDHFLLPFMDQMLERLAENKYFYFFDGFSGYFQIPIDPNDQEKITFTCPFGTYAYRRMPFGLCNIPATFQWRVLVIFHDMIKESAEVFMDDFFVFKNSFDLCLNNLDKMLQRCKDAHLVLNWENVTSWSKKELCLDTRYLSKIARPLTKLLEKDTTFEFDDEFQKAFELLKDKISCANMIVSPNWNLPFELMCDASDFAVRAVLGQKNGKNFHPIYFASKTLNPAQQKYTVTEKELMAVVFAFDKFKSYLILSKTIVHTDHSAIRHLFKKQDAKRCPIRWILLLQEFDIEIKDRKEQKMLQLTTYPELEITNQVMTVKSMITFLGKPLWKSIPKTNLGSQTLQTTWSVMLYQKE
uniref:DNA-directed DNA polymerase n=1 Tax=Tanacetum cinerariifolium TaxID=118510 RepID=A0A6L2JY57_TANCI|nr:DNA-directed DNA polymerase [Tanacetum cinerariifolium]